MAYITGVGRTKFGPSNKTIGQLAYEAMLKALKDSNLNIKDIQAIYISNFLAGTLQNQLHLNSLINSLLPGLNIPIVRVETSCASGGATFHQALLALTKYDPVLVLGVEKMTGFDSAFLSHCISSAGDLYLDQKQGLIFPASFALIASEYIKKYGATENDFAFASLRSHQNANLNPLAHFYQKKITLEEIKSSPIICSPLRLFNCSPISDGAAAVILSKNRRSNRDVKVLASCLKTDSISLAQKKDATSFPATKLAAKEAYQEANISKKDVDLVEVHDGFTIAETISVEDLGLCEPGGWKELIRSGKTVLTGSLPINVSGGLKANGHPIGATGICQLYELVIQLRGEAGSRQVQGAKTGLMNNIGGVGGTAIVTILQKENGNN